MKAAAAPVGVTLIVHVLVPPSVTLLLVKSVTVSEKVISKSAVSPVRGDDPDARAMATVGAVASAEYPVNHG